MAISVFMLRNKFLPCLYLEYINALKTNFSIIKWYAPPISTVDFKTVLFFNIPQFLK